MFEVDAQFRLRGLVEPGLAVWLGDLILEREARMRSPWATALLRRHVPALRDRFLPDSEIAARDVIAWWSDRTA